MLETESTFPKKAFDYSIRLLSLRDYSTHKIKQKLKERGFTQEEISKVITKLLSYQYINDENFTRMKIKQLLVRGHGNSYILQKLSRESLPVTTDMIEELRKDQHLYTLDQIEQLTQKKLRGKEIPEDYTTKIKLKNKIMSFLISKGHDYEEIKTVINRHF